MVGKEVIEYLQEWTNPPLIHAKDLIKLRFKSFKTNSLKLFIKDDNQSIPYNNMHILILINRKKEANMTKNPQLLDMLIPNCHK